MPSAEEQNFLTRDVDVLVHGIKQSLKLSNFKEKVTFYDRTRVRSSPYYERRIKASISRTYSTNDSKMTLTGLDPYAEMKLLIQQGRLINAAVRKLQTMNLEDLSNQVKDDDHEEDDVEVNCPI